MRRKVFNSFFKKSPYLDIVDKNFSETNGKHVLGGFCGAETNVGHHIHSLEASSHSVIDTFRLTPVTSQLLVPVTLMTSEFFRPLFDDLWSGGWCDSHVCLKTKFDD